MFTRVTIKRGTARMSNEKLAAYAGRVATMMAGNLSYPAPVNPTLMQLVAIITTFVDALTAYGVTPGSRGTTAQKATLDAARRDLENSLSGLAFYCENTTRYDAVAFTSAGWDIQSEANPVGVLGPVRNLISIDNSEVNFGEALLRWKRPLDTPVGAVKSYAVHRNTESNFNTSTIVTVSTRTQFRDKDLENTFYYYWVVAVGTAGAGTISDVCLANVKIQPA